MIKENSVGKVKEIEITVGEADSAIVHGSGTLPVFATPGMIGLMENAAYKLAQECMEEGGPEDACTVGTSISVSHMVATPLGMKVRALAKIIAVEGRKIVFEVEAFDEKEKIGEGTHERFVVFGEKFLGKTNSKMG